MDSSDETERHLTAATIYYKQLYDPPNAGCVSGMSMKRITATVSTSTTCSPSSTVIIRQAPHYQPPNISVIQISCLYLSSTGVGLRIKPTKGVHPEQLSSEANAKAVGKLL